MPNAENINKVITLMRQAGPEHFSMLSWMQTDDFVWDNNLPIEVAMTNCNTTACIGGFCALLNAEPDTSILDFHTKTSFKHVTACLFEISVWKAYALTYLYTGNPTMEQAISCLEYLRDTGEVDWDRAVNSVEEGQ